MKYTNNTFKKFLRTSLALISKGVNINALMQIDGTPRLSATYVNNRGEHDIFIIHEGKVSLGKWNTNALVISQLKRLLEYYALLLEHADKTTLMCLSGVIHFITSVCAQNRRNMKMTLEVVKNHLGGD